MTTNAVEFAKLRQDIDLAVKTRVDIIEQRFDGMKLEDRMVYGALCAQTYYWVLHSIPLLMRAVRLMDEGEVKKVFQEHIKEEAGHNLLAANDLNNLTGLHPRAFPELEETKSLYQAAYQAVDRCPESLLGYIYALETAAAEFGLRIESRAKAAFGDNVTSFVHTHGVVDQDHTRIMNELMAHLTLEQLQGAFQLLTTTMDGFDLLMDKINALEFDVPALPEKAVA